MRLVNCWPRRRKTIEQIYPQPGWVEHDAEEIWQNTLAVVKEIVADYPQPIRLSITNQRETVVVFDRATGKPLHNAIVWQCRRGDAICNQLKADQQEATVRSQTGLVIDTYFSASKVRWLAKTFPRSDRDWPTARRSWVRSTRT